MKKSVITSQKKDEILNLHNLVTAYIPYCVEGKYTKGTNSLPIPHTHLEFTRDYNNNLDELSDKNSCKFLDEIYKSVKLKIIIPHKINYDNSEIIIDYNNDLTYKEKINIILHELGHIYFNFHPVVLYDYINKKANLKPHRTLINLITDYIVDKLNDTILQNNKLLNVFFNKEGEYLKTVNDFMSKCLNKPINKIKNIENMLKSIVLNKESLDFVVDEVNDICEMIRNNNYDCYSDYIHFFRNGKKQDSNDIILNKIFNLYHKIYDKLANFFYNKTPNDIKKIEEEISKFVDIDIDDDVKTLNSFTKNKDIEQLIFRMRMFGEKENDVLNKIIQKYFSDRTSNKSIEKRFYYNENLVKFYDISKEEFNRIKYNIESNFFLKNKNVKKTGSYIFLTTEKIRTSRGKELDVSINSLVDLYSNKTNPKVFYQNYVISDKTEKKKILAFFDVSGSMYNINKIYKPTMKAFTETILKKIYDVNIIDFDTDLYLDTYGPYRTMISGPRGGTDPFNTDNWNKIRSFIKKYNPNIILFVSDMSFDYPDIKNDTIRAFLIDNLGEFNENIVNRLAEYKKYSDACSLYLRKVFNVIAKKDIEVIAVPISGYDNNYEKKWEIAMDDLFEKTKIIYERR